MIIITIFLINYKGKHFLVYFLYQNRNYNFYVIIFAMSQFEMHHQLDKTLNVQINIQNAHYITIICILLLTKYLLVTQTKVWQIKKSYE